jgi:hypothetical protein
VLATGSMDNFTLTVNQEIFAALNVYENFILRFHVDLLLHR